MSSPIPIYLLSGFLGSGKTTLLNHTLDYLKECGKNPAVVMNEIGDINIDGKIVAQDVPMTEMLSGCICCTISGDLGFAIYELCRDHHPDVILIEASGVANPLEAIDSITHASLLVKAELRQIVTVIDAPAYLELCRGVKGRLYRLMGEQIMAAGTLVSNKIDKLSPDELLELEDRIRDWNAEALICHTIYARDCLDFLEEPVDRGIPRARLHAESGRDRRGHAHDEHAHDHGHHHEYDRDHNHGHHHEHDRDHNHGHDHGHDHGHHRADGRSSSAAAYHHSHDYVMVYTHYFQGEIDKQAFERFLDELPPNVYRAKGLIRFAGQHYSSMFQYVNGQVEMFTIRRDVEVSNVSVFIGEHFSKQEMAEALQALETV